MKILLFLVAFLISSGVLILFSGERFGLAAGLFFSAGILYNHLTRKL